MFIVICFILAAVLTFGGLYVLFKLARKQDQKRREINEMLEEHKKNKEK